jgi:FtsZ-interacting cell division protein ZipA
MDTGVIIAIVVGALVLVLLVAWALPRLTERRAEQLRTKAGDERYEARNRELSAERAQAAADERAARARREAAQAEASAREASRQRELAGQHRERAHDFDPDMDGEDVYDDDGRRNDARQASERQERKAV